MSDESSVAEVGRPSPTLEGRVPGAAGSCPRAWVRGDTDSPDALRCYSLGSFSKHPLLCLVAELVNTILVPSDRDPNSL